MTINCKPFERKNVFISKKLKLLTARGTSRFQNTKPAYSLTKKSKLIQFFKRQGV